MVHLITISPLKLLQRASLVVLHATMDRVMVSVDEGRPLHGAAARGMAQGGESTLRFAALDAAEKMSCPSRGLVLVLSNTPVAR